MSQFYGGRPAHKSPSFFFPRSTPVDNNIYIQRKYLRWLYNRTIMLKKQSFSFARGQPETSGNLPRF